jgi:hypothetical protein
MGDSDGDAGVESKSTDRPPRPDIRAVNDQTTSAPAATPSAGRDTLLVSIAINADASKVKAQSRKRWAEKAKRAGVRLPWSVTWSIIRGVNQHWIPTRWQPYLVTPLPTHPQSLPSVLLCASVFQNPSLLDT